jgi:hypothetical protein
MLGSLSACTILYPSGVLVEIVDRQAERFLARVIYCD